MKQNRNENGGKENERDVYKQATIFLTNVEIGNKGMITWASFALVMQQLIAVCNTTVLKIK